MDNLLQVVLYGGFNAATAGYPRPFGMPPFLLTLSDQELAATLSHIRTAWGNQASEVSAAQVHALRSRTAAFAVGMKEDRRFDAAAHPLHLPVPDIGVRTGKFMWQWHRILLFPRRASRPVCFFRCLHCTP